MFGQPLAARTVSAPAQFTAIDFRRRNLGREVQMMMGCRNGQKGRITYPFPACDATDGCTYAEQPGSEYVPVEWADGTKGFEARGHVMLTAPY